jgi:hypothetical protein
MKIKNDAKGKLYIDLQQLNKYEHTVVDMKQPNNEITY